MEVRHISYFWKILESSFPANVKDSVKGIRMSKDDRGVVFDLPSDLSSVIKVSEYCSVKSLNLHNLYRKKK